jgi:Leucine-rich repeat (LRR) protein
MIKNIFPQLRFLVLDSNHLNSFNPAENYLPKLEYLYLRNNKLTNFSLATSFFPRLRYLDLLNNELIKIRCFIPFRDDFILLSNSSYSEVEYIDVRLFNQT